MIEINAITNAQGKLEPETALTPEQQSQVISVWFFAGSYKYYVVGEEDQVAAREAALQLLYNDVRQTGNPNWQTNLNEIVAAQQTFGDTYLEEYVAENHPTQNPFE
jgi:hypothetical protein